MTCEIPDSIAAAAGLRPGDELVLEAFPDGVLVTVDRLRKVYVEVTGRCNLQCAMCPREAWAAGSGDMAADLFDCLLAGLPATPPVRFTLAFGGFGEPTVHPRFLDMVAEARQAQCRVELITNGTTMTGEFAQDLAALGVAQVTVSVDGGSDEAHSTMRGIDRDAALEAVARLRQLSIVPPPALDRGEWHNRCRFARDGVVAVSWDGRVTPCLSLLYTHTEHLGGHDKTVRSIDVGHVDRTPLREIWREPQFRELRARLRGFDMSPCLACGGCDISESNEGDCFGTPFPACSECLWAQGIVLCP